MNCRQRACAAILLIVLGFFAGSAWAQTMPPVDDLLKALTNDAEPAGQTKARDQLISATVVGGQPAPPAFLLDYAQKLDRSIRAQLNNKPSFRAKVNLAIVTARVAEKASNGALDATVTQLVKDNEEAVVMWGLKAAQHVIPSLVKVNIPGKVPGLITAIGPAVQKFPSGVVYEEAYAALGSVEDPIATKELLKLWDTRIQMYKAGIPQDPAADGRPVFYLTTKEMWAKIFNTKATQTELMQKICDLVSMAAQHADASPPGDKRDQLVKLVQQCCSGCWAVGTHQNLPGVVRGAQGGIRLNPVVFPPGNKLTLIATDLVNEIRQAFPDVKPPPDAKVAAAPKK